MPKLYSINISLASSLPTRGVEGIKIFQSFIDKIYRSLSKFL